MTYVKIKAGSVIQKQPNFEEGFIEAPDDVICGQLFDGVNYTNPLIVDNRDYKEKRQAEYPPKGDQLDAIWKQLNQDRLGGKNLIQQVDDTLNEVLAIKNKYPKPE